MNNNNEKKHIPFHIGDEIMMERHGRVDGGKLIIGEMSYSTVIIPDHIRFLPNTERLLDEFKAQGGHIVSVFDIEPNNIIDNIYFQNLHLRSIANKYSVFC